MIRMARWCPVQLAILGLLASPTFVAAQACERGLVLETADLRGLTTASPGRVGVVPQLRWPPTTWRDSMWVRVSLFNDTSKRLAAVKLLLDVRGVVASLAHIESPQDPGLAVRPGTGGVLPLPATVTRMVDVGSLKAGERKQVDMPVRLTEIFPWFADTLQTQVLPLAVEFSVLAAIRAAPTTACVDDLRDNYIVMLVPLSYGY